MERLVSFIVERRKALGYSQRELARHAGINPGTLSSIEAFKVTRAPTIPTMEKLARGLGVPGEALIDLVRDSSTQPVRYEAVNGHDAPTALEVPLDDWEKGVIERLGTFNLDGLDPQHGTLLWQFAPDSRRRVLRHLEGIWEEKQAFLSRSGPEPEGQG